MRQNSPGFGFHRPNEIDLPIILIDCWLDCKAQDLPPHASAIATGTLAHWYLRESGIEHSVLTGQIDLHELLAIHHKVSSLNERLRAEWGSGVMSGYVPNPFQAHATDLYILFFSLIRGRKELMTVLQLSKEDAFPVAPILFISQEVGCPDLQYPLRNNFHVISWLIDRIAHTNRFPIIRRYARPADLSGSDEKNSLSIFVSLFARFTGRTYYVLSQVWGLIHLIWRRYLRSGNLSSVMGSRNYQAAFIPSSALRELGIRWIEPHIGELWSRVIKRARLWANVKQENFLHQQEFDGELKRVLEKSFSLELSRAEYEAFHPAIETITSSLSDYVEQCEILDHYIRKEAPIAFISSQLSGSQFERVLAILCSRNRIPVIGLQHGGVQGDLAEGASRIGMDVYLDELELCDEFIAWGEGAAEALSRCHRNYRPESGHPNVVAGSPISFFSNELGVTEHVAIGEVPEITKVLYVPSSISGHNVDRMEWLRGQYLDYFLSMCGKLSVHSHGKNITVKMSPDDSTGKDVCVQVKHRFPNLRFVWDEHSVRELAQGVDFVIIDVAATSLYEIFALPVHILTKQMFADLYPGMALIDSEAMGLLEKRCLIARGYAETLLMVEDCLSRPDRIDWPDRYNREYFLRFIQNPNDGVGSQVYLEVINRAKEKSCRAGC